MGGPLDGIRIVDLSIALAGPWATAMLADQGADVIKVEAPGIGDIGRWIGVQVNGISALFQMVNRGKRSIAVNLRTDEGRDVVRRLVRDADVFVQNFRPGVIERLGLDYQTLRGLSGLRGERGDLVYVSISGFGHEGPYAHKSAYDPVVQAYAGLASLQADPGTQEPQLLRHTAADKITALFAAQAITAALFARDRGRGGQHVRLAMLDATVAFVWADAAGNEVMLDSDGRQPSSFSAAQRMFRYKDGWGIAAPVSDADFAGICKAFGVSGADDPRVATLGERRRHPELMGEIMQRIHEVAPTLTTAEATRRLEAENTPCGIALRTDQLPDDPHVRAIGLLEDSEHPVGGRLRQPRPAARFERTPAATGSPAPTLGQHTDPVLRDLGLADRIDALRSSGAVA